MSPPCKNVFDLVQCAQPPTMLKNLTASSLVDCSSFLTVWTRDPVSIGLTERHPDTQASKDVRVSSLLSIYLR